jgi:sterol desaturase/sphingolipid hydroxylase (fatty acid hydroxylase superfamily)
MSGITAPKPSRKSGDTKQLFNNKLLERLSRTHILVPISILGCFSIFLLYWTVTRKLLPVSTTVGLFFFGLLLFTLVEYLIHRYVFHMAPTSKRKEELAYNFHGVHHEFPKDKDRLAMPPLVSATIVTLLFLILRYTIGVYVFSFLPGFVIGYCAYLGVHFIVHAYQPPKNFFRHLWINHGIHHYKDDERAFGVSSPLWDYVFRTMPLKGKKATSGIRE